MHVYTHMMVTYFIDKNETGYGVRDIGFEKKGEFPVLSGSNEKHVKLQKKK